MSVKVGHFEQFVADPKASRDWYSQALGFDAVSDQGDFQWVKLGDFEILLRPGNSPKFESYRDCARALVLYCTDLSELAEHLLSLGVPVSNGDFDDCLTFQDPDGHWIQAVQAD